MKKTFLKWIIAAIILFIVQFIYNLMGHGVTSNFMNYIWVPAALMAIISLFFKINNHLSKTLINSAVWTIIIGMFLKGVFDIAGTSNILTFAYPISAVLLLFAAIIRLPFNETKKQPD